LARNSCSHCNKVFSCLNLEERASLKPPENEREEEVHDSWNDPDDSRPNVDFLKRDTSNRYFISF
jgi:hypothetical protein